MPPTKFKTRTLEGADAAESALCGYMAWIALAGLVLNAVWKIRWADPVAALSLVPVILHEGWKQRKENRAKAE